jgi:hypothetical protein
LKGFFMDGIYQLVFGGVNNNGEYAENVFHHQIHGTSGSDDAYKTAKALGQAWSTNIQTSWNAICGPNVNANLLTVRKIDGTGGPSAFVPIAFVGAATEDNASFALAADLRLIPDSDGKRSGHWYVWGFSEGFFVNGLMTPFFEGVLANFCIALQQSLTVLGGTSNMVVYEKKTSTGTTLSDIALQDNRPTAFNKRTVPVL